jgi:hypothetical protein
MRRSQMPIDEEYTADLYMLAISVCRWRETINPDLTRCNFTADTCEADKCPLVPTIGRLIEHTLNPPIMMEVRPPPSSEDIKAICKVLPEHECGECGEWEPREGEEGWCGSFKALYKRTFRSRCLGFQKRTCDNCYLPDVERLVVKAPCSRITVSHDGGPPCPCEHWRAEQEPPEPGCAICDESPEEHDRTGTPVVERKGIPDQCPDGGTCYHGCTDVCLRVGLGGPLSGVYPDDQWPDDVIEANAPTLEPPERKQPQWCTYIKGNAGSFPIGCPIITDNPKWSHCEGCISCDLVERATVLKSRETTDGD